MNWCRMTPEIEMYLLSMVFSGMSILGIFLADLVPFREKPRRYLKIAILRLRRNSNTFLQQMALTVDFSETYRFGPNTPNTLRLPRKSICN